MRFEPAGVTDDPDIRIASSVMDYVFRRLALDPRTFETRSELGILSAAERAAQLAGGDPSAVAAEEMDPAEMAQSAPRERRQPDPPARQGRPEQSRPVSGPAASGQPAPGRPASGPSGRPEQPADPANGQAATEPHSSTELLESHQGRTADAPLCLICGTKMRPAGSCYVCEGCGATSGCS
jgi:ribonucleoside-diphosphate reductase alpha chain